MLTRVKTCPKFQVRPWVIDMCPEVVLAVLGARWDVLLFTSTFKASQLESLNIKASQMKWVMVSTLTATRKGLNKYCTLEKIMMDLSIKQLKCMSKGGI